VKGITLNYENSKVVNFTALRRMILDDATPLHVHNPKKIKRKHGGVVVPEAETKEYKVVFKKCRLFHTATNQLIIYLFIGCRNIVQFSLE
jgi:hypothetical protein